MKKLGIIGCFITLMAQGFVSQDTTLITIIKMQGSIAINKIIKEQNLNRDELIFVLNLVKADTIQNKISFSISYIMNTSEFNEINTTHYILLNKDTVLIKGVFVNNLKYNQDYHQLSKPCAEGLKKRLFKDKLPFRYRLYHPILAVIHSGQGGIVIDYYYDDWSYPKEYRIKEFGVEWEDMDIRTMPLEEFLEQGEPPAGVRPQTDTLRRLE